jgi:heme/copper-type cytochrome/quinol oxidase subunit 3
LKVVLGVATIWPILYIFIFFALVIVQFSTLIGGSPDGAFPVVFFILIGLHIFTMFWVMALLVYYIVNVFNNERVPGDKKALWAVVIFLGNMIAMPVYWYLYIWREQDGVVKME